MRVVYKFRAIVLIIIGLFLFSLPKSSLAKNSIAKNTTIDKYIVLGDLISQDYENSFYSSYVSLISNFLSSINSDLEYFNLSENNADINRLIDIINENSAIIKDSDLILISVGFNDIIDLVKDENIVDSDSLDITNDIVLENIIKKILNLKNLNVKIEEVANNFNDKLNEATSKLKEISPDVKIYVNTIYNPISQGENEYEEVDKIISCFNEKIYNKDMYDYDILDAYSTFKDKKFCDVNLVSEEAEIYPNVASNVALASSFIEDYSKYVDIKINNIIRNSSEIRGKTLPRSKVIITSEKGILGSSRTDENGDFVVNINNIKDVTNIRIYVYDSSLVSVLYTMKEISI